MNGSSSNGGVPRSFNLADAFAQIPAVSNSASVGNCQQPLPNYNFTTPTPTMGFSTATTAGQQSMLDSAALYFNSAFGAPFQQAGTSTPTPTAATPSNEALVEVAKRTVVLFRKSHSPVAGSHFRLWLVRAFNLPAHTIIQVSTPIPLGEYRVAFVVLLDVKTHDHILCMSRQEAEANPKQEQYCIVRKAEEVLTEGASLMIRDKEEKGEGDGNGEEGPSRKRKRPTNSGKGAVKVEECFSILMDPSNQQQHLMMAAGSNASTTTNTNGNMFPSFVMPGAPYLPFFNFTSAAGGQPLFPMISSSGGGGMDINGGGGDAALMDTSSMARIMRTIELATQKQHEQQQK